MRTLRTVYLFLVLAGQALARTCPDPTDDPSTDACNQLRYIPSQYGAGVCLGLWILLALAFTCNSVAWPYYRLLPALLGAWALCGGLLIRTLYQARPHWTGGFVGMAILHWVGAWMMTPAITIIFAHLVRHLGAEAYLPHKWTPRKILHVFLWTDGLWLVLQSLGGFLGSLTPSGARSAGEAFYLIGLLGQLVSLVLFSTLYAAFILRTRKDSRLFAAAAGASWRPLSYALGWALCWLLQRSTYRTVLFRGGYKGYLRHPDAQFLALDVVALWLAFVPLAYWWPTRVLGAGNRAPPAYDAEATAVQPIAVSLASVAPSVVADDDTPPPMPPGFIYKTSPEYQQRVDELRAEIKRLEDDAKHSEAMAQANAANAARTPSTRKAPPQY